MIDISKMLGGFSAKDALDALYYAIRYIKQADEISKNSKDFFADDNRSVPSDSAKELCIRVINSLEEYYGSPADKFSSRVTNAAMENLIDAEREIKFSFTKEEEESADMVIRSLIVPKTKD